MKVYFSLAALYIRSFYNLPGKRAPGAKLDGKKISKLVGMTVLVLFLLANLGVMFVGLNLGLYESLASVGMQGMLLLNAVVMATVMTLIIGFLTSLSTYYLNDMELQLLAMPIKPRALFAAKFTAVYVSEAIFSLFFILSAMVIFGIKEQPHPLMYLWGTLAAFLVPIPALAACYFLQVPLLSVARFLKNRQTILLVGGVLGLAMGLGFNLYYQTMFSRLATDPAWIAQNMAGPESLVAQAGRAWPPAYLAWKAMSQPASAQAALSLLGMAAFCLSFLAAAVVVLSGAYAKSLVGFNEVRLRRLGARTGEYLDRNLRRGHAFGTLVLREVRMMNREPMYLLNGPFIIVLMPVIFGIMLAAQKDAFLSDPDMAGLLALLQSGGGAVIAGLAGAFLGSGTSITCTAVSRDAKALPYIKSLPIKAGRYFLAKLAHGLIFGVFGAVAGVGLLTWALGLGASDATAGLAMALGLSALVNMAGLWLDTANPRLKWDNPMAALKQNPNSVIMILGTMGLIGGAGYLAFSQGLSSWQAAAWFGLVPGVAFAALLAAFPAYAERRLTAMEV